jgi:hypothetical protein
MRGIFATGRHSGVRDNACKSEYDSCISSRHGQFLVFGLVVIVLRTVPNVLFRR